MPMAISSAWNRLCRSATSRLLASSTMLARALMPLEICSSTLRRWPLCSAASTLPADLAAMAMMCGGVWSSFLYVKKVPTALPWITSLMVSWWVPLAMMLGTPCLSAKTAAATLAAMPPRPTRWSLPYSMPLVTGSSGLKLDSSLACVPVLVGRPGTEQKTPSTLVSRISSWASRRTARRLARESLAVRRSTLSSPAPLSSWTFSRCSPPRKLGLKVLRMKSSGPDRPCSVCDGLLL
mmetsp:Transcript_70151/g.186915  ORF Transcript_70151/g.186915 Transcript_70151/m.186915 type:complete len:237 (+) Transcript_70151:1207-1917(+)